MNKYTKQTFIIVFTIIILTLSGCAKISRPTIIFRGDYSPTNEAQTLVFTPSKENYFTKIIKVKYFYIYDEIINDEDISMLYPEDVENYGQKCKGPWFDVYSNGETFTIILQKNTETYERELLIAFEYTNGIPLIASNDITIIQVAAD